MKLSLAFSYQHCQQIARQAASNFYFAFYLLPPQKRRAMYALYAFLRHTDDLSDNEESVEQRRQQLANWRTSLQSAFVGDFRDPILPALMDTVRQYAIPEDYLYAVIEGVEMDLEHRPLDTAEELETYCYHVASVVGMACIHIWGFSDPRALVLAETCGQAFQLTNILRDLKEDALRGRIYLPLEDLVKYDYSQADLKECVADDRYKKLMAYEVGKAADAYGAVDELYQYLSRDGQRILAALSGTYMRLLEKIAADPGQAINQRVHLSAWEKLRIACYSAIAPCRCTSTEVKRRTAGLMLSSAPQADSL